MKKKLFNLFNASAITLAFMSLGFASCSNLLTQDYEAQSLVSAGENDGLYSRQAAANVDAVDFSNPEATKAFYDFSDLAPGMKVSLDVERKIIIQKAVVSGVEFTHTTDFETWTGEMTYEQARESSRVFWKCYPQMYLRMHNKDSYTQVNLHFRSYGHNPAGTGGNDVDLDQGHMKKHKYDYDVLVHEYAHVLQNINKAHHCPYVIEDGKENCYFIERFADVCRFEYAIDGGYYNDAHWTLNTIEKEDSYVTSVRFWLWIDYKYSTKDADFLKEVNKYIKRYDIAYEDLEGDGLFWQKCLKKTKAKGKTLEQLWKEYKSSKFSTAGARVSENGHVSHFISKYDVRNTIRSRYE